VMLGAAAPLSGLIPLSATAEDGHHVPGHEAADCERPPD